MNTNAQAPAWSQIANEIAVQLSDVSLDVLQVVVRATRSTTAILQLRFDVVDDGNPAFWLSLPVATQRLLDAVAPTFPNALSEGWCLPLTGFVAQQPLPALLVWREAEAREAASLLQFLFESKLRIPAKQVTLNPETCAPGETERRTGVRVAAQRVRSQRSRPGAFADAFCDRCGQPLTHPESVAVGVGPECRRYYSPEYFRVMSRRNTPPRMLLGAKKPAEWLDQVKSGYAANA